MAKTRLLAIMTGALLLLISVWSASAQAQYQQAFTWQQFEAGAMLYDANNGSISVLYEAGGLLYFSSETYGHLPDYRPTGLAPDGRVWPTMGFGKVWGYFSNVRAGLGWAISSEQAFTSTVTHSNTSLTLLPPRARERITLDFAAMRWYRSGGHDDVYPTRPPIMTVQPPPPTPTPDRTGYIPPFGDGNALASTYQPFEGGSMIWLAGTGDIIVLFANGRYDVVRPWEYVSLPDNPVAEATPSNRFRPIFGFGKVWGNDAALRRLIGWAILPEQGRLAVFGRDDSRGTFSLDLPDGDTVLFDATTQTWNNTR